MKKIAFLFISLALTTFVSAQEEGSVKQLPSVTLKDMEGKTVNTGALGFEGPVIVSFWATWCSSRSAGFTASCITRLHTGCSDGCSSVA